jgi:hypothetical protein
MGEDVSINLLKEQEGQEYSAKKTFLVSTGNDLPNSWSEEKKYSLHDVEVMNHHIMMISKIPQLLEKRKKKLSKFPEHM